MNRKQSSLLGGSAIVALLVFAFIAAMISSGLTINNEKQVAVITRFGKVQRTVGAGWNFRTPFVTNAVQYRIDVETAEAQGSAGTKDLQSVDMKVNVNYRIDGAKVEDLYRDVKNPVFLSDSIIPPIIQESFKSVAANYTASELLTKRDEVKTVLIDALQERLGAYHLTVVTVNIEDFEFNDGFDRAIEQKVIAEQEVLRRTQELEKEKVNTQIAEERAKQTQIEGQALQANPEILQQQYLQKWDGKLPLVSGETGGNIIDISSLTE